MNVFSRDEAAFDAAGQTSSVCMSDMPKKDRSGGGRGTRRDWTLEVKMEPVVGLEPTTC
jgi:hypothetical protein